MINMSKDNRLYTIEHEHHGCHRVLVRVYGEQPVEVYSSSLEDVAQQVCDSISSSVGGYDTFNVLFPTMKKEILELSNAA